MIKLVVDVGNTNSKLFVFDKNRLLLSEIADSDQKTAIFLNEIKKKYIIEACIVSSVREIDAEINNNLNQIKNCIFFDYRLKLPITNLYKTPETLGPDRIAAVVGASSLFPSQNIIVIDAGTAITYDIILANMNYIGGNISPGIQTRFKALNTFTGKLPLLSIDMKNENIIGTTTNEAILCGVQNGIIWEIEGLVAQIGKRYGDIKVLVTGGDYRFLVKSLKIPIFAESNLTAIGLNKILELNV